MRKHNAGFISLMVCFLMLVSVAHSSPMQLQYNDVRFPVTVNFTTEPHSIRTPNPAIPGSYIYLFVHKDAASSLTFAVSLTPIPNNMGSIPAETAQMMIADTLSNQVSNVDKALGVVGEVTNEPSKIPSHYPSKTIEVWRQTTPPQFGRYTSFIVDRLLVSVFASGLSKKQNRDAVRSFVDSVVVQKAKVPSPD
ncbi:MAG: hypothetical protein KKH12_01110 [Gammaproteobacteria bacterium]|nr:hypothetical protein [Gammaproteobacteria bacterium]MBU1480250.1 hypothetical protein [Gammaproteobacteria bacterium]